VSVTDPIDCCLLQQRCGSRVGHRPRFGVGTRSTHAHFSVETQSFTCLHFEVETRPWLRSAFWRNNATFAFNERTRPLRESVFGFETRPSRLTWDSRFEILSLVIFRQPTELPPKFSKLHGWLERISEHFETSCWLGPSWFGLTICWSILRLILSRSWSSWVYCWTTWSLKEDHHKYLEMQSRTSLWFAWLSVYCWTDWVVDLFYQCTVEPLQKRGHSSCVGENMTLIWYATVVFCVFGRNPHKDVSQLIVTFKTRGLRWRVSYTLFAWNMGFPSAVLSSDWASRSAPRILAIEWPIKDPSFSEVKSFLLSSSINLASRLKASSFRTQSL